MGGKLNERIAPIFVFPALTEIRLTSEFDFAIILMFLSMLWFGVDFGHAPQLLPQLRSIFASCRVNTDDG